MAKNELRFGLARGTFGIFHPKDVHMQGEAVRA